MGALALHGLGPPHGSHISPGAASSVGSMWRCDIDPVAVGTPPYRVSRKYAKQDRKARWPREPAVNERYR